MKTTTFTAFAVAVYSITVISAPTGQPGAALLNRQVQCKYACPSRFEFDPAGDICNCDAAVSDPDLISSLGPRTLLADSSITREGSPILPRAVVLEERQAVNNCTTRRVCTFGAAWLWDPATQSCHCVSLNISGIP